MTSVYFPVVLCLMLPLIYGKPVRSGEYDHFVFVEQYPAGVCQYYSAIGSGHNCHYPSNASSWTMHGLWPTYETEMGPNYCNKSATFSLDVIQKLVPRLVREWTNLENNTAFGSFWSHEFLKHGTCSNMGGENSFFSQVLEIFESDGMQFGDVLSNHDITPNANGYSVDDITNAFKNQYGVTPILQCFYSKKCGQIIKQVELCLDLKFHPIDCPSGTSSCRTSEPVQYPPSVYSK